MDGNADDPTKDEPIRRRQRKAPNWRNRYEPLDVKVYKSPRKEGMRYQFAVN